MSVQPSTSTTPYAASLSRQEEATVTDERSLEQLPSIEVSEEDSLGAPNPSSRSSSPTASPAHREHSNPLDSNASMIIESDEQVSAVATSAAEPIYTNSFASGPRFAVAVPLEQDESPPSELVGQELPIQQATTPDFLGQLQIKQAVSSEVEEKERTPSSKHSTPVTTIITGQPEEQSSSHPSTPASIHQEAAAMPKTPSPKASNATPPPAIEPQEKPAAAPNPTPATPLATIDKVVIDVAPGQDNQNPIEEELQDALLATHHHRHLFSSEVEAKERTPSSKHSTPAATITTGQSEEQNSSRPSTPVPVEQEAAAMPKTPSPKASNATPPPAIEPEEKPAAAPNPTPATPLATIDEVVIDVTPGQDNPNPIEAELQDAMQTPLPTANNAALRPIEPRPQPAAPSGICSRLFGFCFGKKE